MAEGPWARERAKGWKVAMKTRTAESRMFSPKGVLLSDRAGLRKAGRKVKELMTEKSINLPSNVDAMLQGMGVAATIDDPAQIQRTIMEGILSSDSLEDIFSENMGELENGRNLINVPVHVTGVRWNGSDYAEDGSSSLPFYGVVEAVKINTDGTLGDKVNFSCGATTALAQLWKTDTLGAYPLDLVLVESGRTTKSGFKPYWFKKSPVAAKVVNISAG